MGKILKNLSILQKFLFINLVVFIFIIIITFFYLGAIKKNNDVLLVFSVSGESSELNSILRYANRHNIPAIGVSCKATSMLMRYSTIKILLPKVVEAGHSLAPTSSSLNFLSWGDALAIACMNKKRFTNKNFMVKVQSSLFSPSVIFE